MSAALALLASVALASLVGGMIFFAGIMAPTIFTVLEAEPAGRLIRRVFPRYYAYLATCAGLAAVGFARSDHVAALGLIGIGLVAVWLQRGLMPMINRRRDAELAGDVQAKTSFDRLHRLSVIINVLQLIAALAVLWRATLP